MTSEWKFMRRIILVLTMLATGIVVWFGIEMWSLDHSYPYISYTHQKIVEKFIESIEAGSKTPLEKVSNHPDCRDQVHEDIESIRVFAHPTKVESYEFSVAETNHEDEDSTALYIATEEGEKLRFFLWAKVKGFPGKQYLCGIGEVPG